MINSYDIESVYAWGPELTTSAFILVHENDGYQFYYFNEEDNLYQSHDVPINAFQIYYVMNGDIMTFWDMGGESVYHYDGSSITEMIFPAFDGITPNAINYMYQYNCFVGMADSADDVAIIYDMDGQAIGKVTDTVNGYSIGKFFPNDGFYVQLEDDQFAVYNFDHSLLNQVAIPNTDLEFIYISGYDPDTETVVASTYTGVYFITSDGIEKAEEYGNSNSKIYVWMDKSYRLNDNVEPLDRSLAEYARFQRGYVVGDQFIFYDLGTKLVQLYEFSGDLITSAKFPTHIDKLSLFGPNTTYDLLYYPETNEYEIIPYVGLR